MTTRNALTVSPLRPVNRARGARVRGTEASSSGIRAEVPSDIPRRTSAACEEQQCGSRLRVGAEAHDERVAVSRHHHRHPLTTYLVNADLQKHPTVQSGRLPSFDDAREEAVDFLRSKSAWVDDPMDSPPSRQQTAKCECLTSEKLDTARLPSACLGQGSQEHHAWLTRWQTR